jgi:hypothetical protein
MKSVYSSAAAVATIILVAATTAGPISALNRTTVARIHPEALQRAQATISYLRELLAGSSLQSGAG